MKKSSLSFFIILLLVLTPLLGLIEIPTVEAAETTYGTKIWAEVDPQVYGDIYVRAHGMSVDEPLPQFPYWSTRKGYVIAYDSGRRARTFLESFTAGIHYIESGVDVPYEYRWYATIYINDVLTAQGYVYKGHPLRATFVVSSSYVEPTPEEPPDPPPDEDQSEDPPLPPDYPPFLTVDQAITLGETYIDRMYYSIDANYAIMKDYASLPYRLYVNDESEWILAGEIDGRCKVQLLKKTAITTWMYHKWDLDDDGSYDDIVLYSKYTYDDGTDDMELWVQELTYDTGLDVDVYIGANNPFSGDEEGATHTYNQWGFPSNTYITRHATRMLAHYYNNWTANAAEATKLNAFMDDYGFTMDVYDPMFNASNSYADNFFVDDDTFPDPELFDAGTLPTGPAYQPYKSKLALPVFEIYGEYLRDIYLLDIIEKLPYYDCLFAQHLMNKYGDAQLAQAKALIDRARWDGFGTRRWFTVSGYTSVQPYYSMYNTAVFLSAVSQYAKLSGDADYLEMADQAARIILMGQWTVPFNTEDLGSVYRTDFEGGFVTNYLPSGSLMWLSSMGIKEYAFWALEQMVDIFNWAPTGLPPVGSYSFLSPEMAGMIAVNAETTLVCLQALQVYKDLLAPVTTSYPGADVTVDVQTAVDPDTGEPNVVEEGSAPVGGSHNEDVEVIDSPEYEATIEIGGTTFLGGTARSRGGVIVPYTPDTNQFKPTFRFAIRVAGRLITVWSKLYMYVNVTYAGGVLWYHEEVVATGAQDYEYKYFELVEQWEGNFSKRRSYEIEFGVHAVAWATGEYDFRPYPYDYIAILWFTVSPQIYDPDPTMPEGHAMNFNFDGMTYTVDTIGTTDSGYDFFAPRYRSVMTNASGCMTFGGNFTYNDNLPASLVNDSSKMEWYILNLDSSKILASGTILSYDGGDTRGEWTYKEVTITGLLVNASYKIGFGRRDDWDTDYQLTCSWRFIYYKDPMQFHRFPGTPSIVSETDSGGSRWLWQRNSFYSKGLFWVFWNNLTSASLVYQTSSDNEEWSSPITVIQADRQDNDHKFSIWFNGTHVSYVRCSAGGLGEGDDVMYRLGEVQLDGTIDWCAIEQTVLNPAADGSAAKNTYITVDTSNRPFIGYSFINKTAGDPKPQPYISYSTTSNGVWTTAAGHPYKLSSEDTGYWEVSAVPLTDDKIYAFYVRHDLNGQVHGREWDGANWGAEENITGAGDYTETGINFNTYHSCVAHQDEVHVAYTHGVIDYSESEEIRYNKRYNNGTWGANYTLLSGFHAWWHGSPMPTMSIDTTTGNLYVFWAGYPVNNWIFYTKCVDGTWDDVPTAWTKNSMAVAPYGLPYYDRIQSFYQAYDNKIGVTFLVNVSSYDLMFDYLDLAPEDDCPIGAPVWYASDVPPEYLFFQQGRDTLIQDLWRTNYGAFTDSPGTDFFYWTDDQAKAMLILSQNVSGDDGINLYDSYIQSQLSFIDSLTYGDMVVRRKIDPMYPVVVSSDPSGFDMDLRFYIALRGALEAPDWEDAVLRLFYRQSENEMAWIKGQSVKYDLYLDDVDFGLAEWNFEEHITESSIVVNLPTNVTLTQIAIYNYSMVTMQYTITQDLPYVHVKTTIQQDPANPGGLDVDMINVEVRNAFDQLSMFGTPTGGPGADPLGYKYVWFHGYGEKAADGTDGQHLLDGAVQAAWDTDYFIIHMHDIPDIFDRSLAIGVQLYNRTALLNVDNFLNPADPTWEKLHHIVMYYNHTDINDTDTTSFIEMKYSLMNAHNWMDMDNYDTFYTTWTTLDDDFQGVDLSLDHQMGIILYGIAEYYYQSGNNETFVRALFDYWYNDTYIACGNGSYMQALPYAIVAAYRIYQRSGNDGYETAALALMDDMLERQQMNAAKSNYGGFREWGGAEYVYLDYTGPAGYALWWMYAVTGNDTYQTRRVLGTETLWIDEDTGAIKCYKDEDGLYEDDDINTYKSAMLMVGLTLDIDTELTWTAMSHLWQRTTDDLMNPRINVTYAGLDWGQEINTETQSWGLLSWLMWAQYQYSYFGYYVRYFGSEGAVTDYDFDDHPNLGLTIDLGNQEYSNLHFWSGGYRVTSITGATSWLAKAIPSDHLDVTISDMFPADSDMWVFVGERYDVVAEYGTTIIVDAVIPFTTDEVTLHMEEGKYDSVTLIGEMKTRFFDKWMWTELVYSTVTGSYTMTYDDDDYSVIGSVYKYKDPAGIWNVNVTFPIVLGDYIIDAQDVDMYMWCTGRQVWELMQSDYFNLYCIGGLTEYEFGGDGNRTIGGDMFELEVATTGSWAAANVTWKNLQHIHLLFHWDTGPTQIGTFLGGDMRMECPSDDEHTGAVTYTMYAVDPSGVWTKELYVILDINSGAVGTYGINRDQAWVELRARWYDQTGDLLKTDYFMTYHEAYRQFGFNTTTALKPTMPIWLDLWYNKENASSVVGGRTNAYWHGHKEYGSASWWPGYGKFKPIWSNATQSMFFADLLDSTGEITSARELKLMKIGVNISKAVGEDGCNHKWRLRDFDVFTKQQAAQYMEGIDTPSSEFQPAQDPSLPMGGFLGGLVAAISKMAGNIVTGLTTMLRGTVVEAIGFMDWIIFTISGRPNLFSTILSAISSFYDFFIVSLVMVVEMLTQLFIIIPGLFRFLITIFANMVGFLIRLFTIVGSIFDGTMTGVGSIVDVWELFSVEQWLSATLASIILFVSWVDSLDKRSEKAGGGWMTFFINDSIKIMYVMNWVLTIMLKAVDFFIDKLFTVFEAIPGIG